MNMSYEQIESADTFLNVSKRICLMYMTDNSSIDDVDNDELVSLFEFVVVYDKMLKSLKTRLSLDSNHFSFSELSNSIDLLTKTKSLSTQSDDVLYTKISKDVNFILNELLFCYSILKNIITERNIFNN